MRNRIAIVDIATRKFKALSYKQYDINNILQIVVMENNKIVDISSYNATIYFKLPSEKTYRTIGIIKNNTINVTLSSSVLKEYGKVILEVKLSNGDEIVTTFSIYLNVEKSIDSTDSSDADDDPNLEDIHHTHNNKEVLDQITQEMIDTIVLGGGFVDLTDYQTKEDMNLTTIDKTIVGSINELNEKIDNVNIDNIDLSDYVTKTELDAKGYLTEHQDISGKADKTEIPTRTSQLTNDSDFATNSSVDEKIANANIGGTVDLTSYAKKTDLPTKTSQLTNDSGFITEHQDISNKADKSEIPTKTSQLANDNNFISSIPSEYITETELESKGYLTEHQSLDNYALKSEIPTVPTKISQLQNDSNFISSIPEEYVTEQELNNKGLATETFVTNKIAEAQLSGGESSVDLTNYQTKSDDTLTTTSKTVVGAINEVNTNVMMKANNTFEASMTTVSSLGGIPAGSDLNGLSLQQVLTKLLFPYIKPSVSASLTYSPSVSVYEYGQSISVSKINTNVTKKSENIVSIKFYQNNTLINTISSDCSNGGSFSHTFTSPITITSNISNSYFKVIINDGISDVTATTNSFTFVYPYYYGVIANDVEITEDLIKGLTKQVVTKGNKSYTYSPNFQKMVIAYPKSYGVLKSILDPNGFEQKASFTVTELNIIGLNGTSQAYYVYTNGASTNTNFTMQFKY